MCFRSSSTTPTPRLEHHFRATFTDPAQREVFHHVSAFVFPRLPVITAAAPGVIALYRWGLIPRWVKNSNQTRDLMGSTLNARLETITEKPSFREVAANRCLVLIDGFFEFREVAGKKYPYFIKLKSGDPFALGGLYSVWTDPEGGDEYPTFTILTTEASSFLAQIHNTKKRMPVMLAPEGYATWLNPTLKPEAAALLPDEALEAFPVSRDILLAPNRANQPTVTQLVEYPALYDGHLLC